MNFAVIGLGRMGGAVAYRAAVMGHQVFGFDPDKESCEHARKEGIEIVDSIAQIASKADVFWLMVPAGEVVDAVIQDLRPHLKAGNIIIDGGNSNYKDSIRRAQLLQADGITFLDCGTSGGLYGRSYGFCLMIGGDQSSFFKIHEILETI